MVNYDGQYEVNVIYDVTISSRLLTHRMTFDVILEEDPPVGTPFSDFNVVPRLAANTPLSGAIDELFSLLWENMGTGTSQPVFELYKYDAEPATSKTFISSYESALTFSLGATAAIAAHQTTFTLRSTNGGYGRIQLMEDAASLETKVLPSASGADRVAVFDFLSSGDGFVVARDGGYFFAGMHCSFGQNEKLKRKRFRTE